MSPLPVSPAPSQSDPPSLWTLGAEPQQFPESLPTHASAPPHSPGNTQQTSQCWERWFVGGTRLRSPLRRINEALVQR